MTSPPAVAQVARLRARGEIVLAAEEVDPPGPDEVLLTVTAVGLCGSDLHWYEDGAIGDVGLTRPLVLGHEFSGVIATGPRAGQRVAVEPGDPCGTCRPCQAGKANLCVATRFAGHGPTDGALRSVMAWPDRLCLSIPDAIAADDAALLEPLGVALHALDLARIPLGGTAGVYGCGPLGLLLVQLLRLAGASTVVATDLLEHRVAAAAALGATHAIQLEPAVDGAASPAADRPVDVAFEVAGTAPALLDALTAVRPGGRVVIVGIPSDDRTSFPASLARRKGLTILVCRRMAPTDLGRAIDLVARGHVDTAPLITDRYPLARVGEAFEALASRRGLKVIVRPSVGAG